MKTQFQPTPKQITNRLTNILENQLQNIFKEFDNRNGKVLAVNESLLQDWCNLINSLVYLKDIKQKPVRAVRVTSNIIKHQTIQFNQVSIIPPRSTEQVNNKYLLNIQTNTIDVYQINKQSNINANYLHHFKKINFKKGIIRKFSTYTFYDQDNVILIGGCRETNPNIKCKDIFQLNLNQNEAFKIGELPWGISSHAAVKIKNKIYVVGGNKDMNIVTKCCFQFDITTRKSISVASLNYPSASHTIVSWKDRFIYKIGGIGSCFGEWDLSPYIERFNIEQQLWQIINPILNINDNLLSLYSLLVNSLAYESNRSSIVILGGFDFDREGSNKLFQLQIREEMSQDSQDEMIHQIVNLGLVKDLHPGGFMQQEPIFIDNNMFAIQTVSQSQNLTHKIAKIKQSLCYI